MDNITKIKPPNEEEENEEEDAPSLSDFPLNSSELEKIYSPYKTQDKQRRSFSEPSDFFGFFNDFTAEMSHADDIIFRGKLVPYGNQHQIFKSLSADDATRFSRRNNLRSSIRSNSLTSTRPPRSRRFLGGKTLGLSRRRRDLVKSDAADIRRSFSKSSAISEGSSKASTPRWFVLMFGPLRLQPEMDLRDMKSRQFRRSPGIMFPSMGAGGFSRNGRRSFCGFDLLRVLTCKSHASVAATASVGLAPRF